MIEQASSNSSISLCFGERIYNNCPFNIKADFILFSEKFKNMKFNMTEYLKTQIPNNSLLLELETTEDAEDIAIQIQKVIQTPQINENLNRKNVKVQCFGKNQKIYILIIVQGFSDGLNSLNKFITAQTSKQENIQILSLTLKSMKSLKQITKDIENIDVFVGMLDSLEAKLTFIKSQITMELIQSIFKNSEHQTKIEQMLKMLDHFDLRLKCSNGALIQNYENVFSPVKVPLQHKFSMLQNKFKNKVKGYLFGQILSINLLGEIQNINIFLDILFS